MKSTYQRKSLMYAHQISVKSASKMFFKVGKRRILLYVLIAIVFFAIFTSVIFVWNSYKIDLYQKYSEENSYWFDDHELNVVDNHIPVHEYLISDLHGNFLEAIHSKYINQYYSFLPDESIRYSTGMAALKLYITRSEIGCSLNTLDKTSGTLLPNCITQGRMPENETEILYYKNSNSESQFTMGENISLAIYKSGSASNFSHNYTIVGIIENLNDAFVVNNESKDILEWRNHLTYDIITHQFYTTTTFFDIAAQKWHEYGRMIYVADFFFDWNVMNYRKMFYYQHNIERKIKDHGVIFHYPDLSADKVGKHYYEFSFEDPLYKKLLAFNNYFIQESIRIMAIILPILSLIFFTCLESFNIDAQKLKITFLTMKKYGIEYKYIRKILFAEGLLTISGSFVSGCSVGILGGFLIATLQNYQIAVLSFLGGLLLPIYWVPICLFALFFFISGFLTEKGMLKELEFFKAKEPKKIYQKITEKIYSYPEGRLLLPGIITTALGILGLYLLQMDRTILTEFYSIYLISLLVFYSLLFVGVIILVGIFCWFLAKILTRGIGFIGKKVWQWKKSKLTLSLKNFEGNNKDYRRFFLVTFLALICIVPGLIIGQSCRNHMELESHITNGCTDLVVRNWINNETIITELYTHEDITATTEVVLYRFSYFIENGLTGIRKDYVTFVLGINNPEIFSQIIDYNQLGDISYSENQIRALENESTYLMSSLYAKKNGYDTNETILYYNQICPSIFQDPLKYIGSFEHFPLLPIHGREPLSNNRVVSFSLVTNSETADDIAYAAREDYVTITEENYLMIKSATTTTEEREQLREELRTQYQMEFTTDNEEKRPVLDRYNNFISSLLVITTVVAIAILVFFGIFTTQIIFQKRMKIIETQFRLGINKKQIWLGFTIENLLITIIPVIISVITAYPVLHLIDEFLLVKWLLYNRFALWLPLWFVLLVSLVEYIVQCSIWSITLIRPIKQYRPIKQE